MKRGFDIVVGTALALLAIPVIVVVAASSLLVLRAWPFFVQERVGWHGRTFRLVKVRTLPRSTPRYACKTEMADLELPASMRLLRRLHLDELPQLFLVPLGTMSLVGPRPELPGLHDLLDPDFATERTGLRPGCTGLWQIGARKHDRIGDAPEFDRHYVRHGTLRLDLWITARSLRSLVRGGRTVGLADIPAWTGAAGSGAEAATASAETA